MNSNTEKPESTLYQKAVQGGVWLFSLRYFGRALDLVRAVVLARLLLPRDFGQMAIALLSVSILDTFTQVGVGEALIQRKEDIHGHLDTAWTMGILRGALVFAILLFVAPWITLFFDGSGQVRTSEVRADQIALQIRRHPGSAAASLLEHVRETSRSGLLAYDPNEGFPAPIKENLTADLNRMITTQRLWEHPSFAEIPLSAQTRKLLEQKVAAGDQERANRLLLEELFAEGKGIQPAVLDRHLVAGIIRVISFVYFLGTLTNIGIIYFNRNLQFARQFLFRSVGLLGGTTVALVTAFLYRSVWALVFGRLTDVVLICLLSYILHPYRPRWHLDWEKVRSLWRYGRHIMWTTIVDFMINQGDSLFVGKVLGTTSLGLYRYALRFSNLGASEVQGVLRQVTFPAFSRIQDDPEKIVSGYKKTIRYITLLAYPICGGLFVLAPEFVSVILGSAWLTMVPAMRALCILSLFYCVHTGVIYRSQGRPDFQTRVSLIRLVIIVLSVYPLTHWFGLVGTALSLLLSILLIFPYQFGLLNQLIGFSLANFLRLVFVPFAGTAVMVTGLAVLKPWFRLGPMGNLILLAGIGAMLYLGSVYLLSYIDTEYSPRQFYLGIRKGWK